MSLEAALKEHGGFSPTGSGRSSPVLRSARSVVEDGLYKTDKSLKRYAATIERALASWEISPEEWADYIAFLARLLKAIQAHPTNAPFLPHSRSIATRLAQCLNPALPSGVHQKSLEVYTYIFSTFGSDYLSAHLHEYLSGLSAVLSFASLSVRPALYELFEKSIVPLPSTELRPALKSLILSLLPALEEETAEDFERAFAILRSLEVKFVPDVESIDLTLEPDGYFWQCLFLSVITNPSRRQGALNYLVQRLPTLAPPNKEVHGGNGKPQLTRAADCVVAPEPGLLVRCFVCGLSDPQILIQRGFLDLLVSHLPLNSAVLQHRVGNEDLDRLVSAATQVLLRRDMSLNRRLWSWFLGPEPKDQGTSSQPSSPVASRNTNGDSEANAQLRYFARHGQSSLQRCILKMLQQPASTASLKARPYRICLSLMDRWEIGGPLVPKVFLPAMRTLHEYSLSAATADVAEVVRSASLFFDGVEASLIWECLLGTLHETIERGQSMTAAIDMFDWIVHTFNVEDEEMLNIHVPQAIVYLVTCLGSTSLDSAASAKLIHALLRLLELVPSTTFQDANERTKSTRNTDTERSDASIRANVLKFYRDSRQSGGKGTAPLSGAQITRLLGFKIVQLLSQALSVLEADRFAQLATLLLACSANTNDSVLRESNNLKTTLTDGFESTPDRVLPFPILQSIVALATSWPAPKVDEDCIVESPVAHVEAQITSQLWHYMSPERPKYHVEAAKAFWQLDGLVFPNDAVTSSLLGLSRGMVNGLSSSNDRVEASRRFTVLWAHSLSALGTKAGPGRRGSAMSVLQDAKHVARAQDVLQAPLLLVLDALNYPTEPTFDVIKSWLHTLPSLDQVFRILFNRLLESSSMIYKRGPVRAHAEHVREAEYVLTHFQNILAHGNDWIYRTLSGIQKSNEDHSGNSSGIVLLASQCIELLFSELHTSETLNRRVISVLDLLLSSQINVELKDHDVDSQLLERLMVCIAGEFGVLQGGVLRLVQLALNLRLLQIPPDTSANGRPRGSVSQKRPSNAQSVPPRVSRSSTSMSPSPPQQLFTCIRTGFSSNRTRNHLEKWVAFLGEVLPIFADALFANVLPLVECFCDQLQKLQDNLEQMSRNSSSSDAAASESAATSLLEGLEMILDRAYECLMNEKAPEPTTKGDESKTNFLTNVTSGVFKSETPPGRTNKSNSRLTVILALQDSIRAALRMWLWASSPTDTPAFDISSASTTAHIALKLRNKARHLLEQIFSVEPLESLEVVIAHWSIAGTDNQASAALSLLHVMQVSKPKNVVPATLDALCSRTNPSVLPQARNSSLTIELSPSDVAAFFSAYLDSTEDDAIDELWPDCIAFLRDVLANPLPYRQVLPHFLSIILLLAEKLNNTNFGEQRKMRRDLGDIFQRLLTATFTTLPSGYLTDRVPDHSLSNVVSLSRRDTIEHSQALVPVLNRVTFKLDLILETQERMASAINNITQSLLSPIMRSKSFPKNIDEDVLTLIVHMTRKTPAAKTWKKEVADAFNDPRFLSSPPELMAKGWFPVLHQWSLHDKERITELLSRLTPPSSAGIMFGVGASAARVEADRRTQLNLRRLCVMLLSSPEDTYITQLRPIEEKISELFEASPSSSPSSAIKAELFLLCRAMTLSIGNLRLSPLWPIINDKLEAALTSLLPGSPHASDFNNLSILQACKLLDLLITLSPDEFQLHEWLYVTDTIDAVYGTSNLASVALSDQIAETLTSTTMEDNIIATTPVTPGGSARGKRRLLLGSDMAVDKEDIKALPKEEFVKAVIRPFLSQLSIHAYEGVYSMEQPDEKDLREELLRDVLEVGSVVD